MRDFDSIMHRPAKALAARIPASKKPTGGYMRKHIIKLENRVAALERRLAQLLAEHFGENL